MKFGERIKRESMGPYKDFYMDYAFLKDFVKDSNVNYELFLEAIYVECKKINSFVQAMHNHDTFTINNLLIYILFNYIGFYKIFKKYDKLRSQNKKLLFYDIISRQRFYEYYHQHTQKFSNDIHLVVFDKDRILVNNSIMFGNWTIQLIRRLENVFPNLTDRTDSFLSIWDHLMYDKDTNTFSANSIIAKGTNDDIRNSICDYIINKRQLVECNNIADRRKIISMIRDEWFDVAVTSGYIKECGNVRALFEFLKMKNIKIAICTSDDRKPTEQTLKYMNIDVEHSRSNQTNHKIARQFIPLSRRESFKIDYLVCGNDMIPNKPSPEPLLTICRKLKIHPSNAMIVGDTLADIHAGINARFSKTIGVLSGNYSDVGLITATHIIGSIDSLPELFMAMEDSLPE